MVNIMSRPIEVSSTLESLLGVILWVHNIHQLTILNRRRPHCKFQYL